MRKRRLDSYRTCLITGATRGIGFELARALAKMGKELVLVSRNEQDLLMAGSMLRKNAAGVCSFACDLTSEQDLNRLTAAIGNDLPHIDLLVNNAGIASYGEFEPCEIRKQMEIIELNVCSIVKLTHALLPRMLRQRRGGILNVASTAGFMSIPFNAVYCATKAFVINFSLAIAAEVRDRNVVVSCLCPGPTESSFWKTSGMDGLIASHGTSLQPSEQVARYGLSLIDSARPLGIPGLGLKLKHLVRTAMPRRLLTSYLYHHMKPRI